MVTSTTPASSVSGGSAQQNVVNIAQKVGGSSSVVNISSSGHAGQVAGVSGGEVRVVVEVKDEHKERPVILSLGSDAEELYRLDGLLEKMNSQTTELTELQQLQAQQLKALFPGLANVCPQFIARIQKAAGPLFQAHLQQQQLQQQLEQQQQRQQQEEQQRQQESNLYVKTEPSTSSVQTSKKLSPLAPIKIKSEVPDKPCILIDSDSEENELKPLVHSPRETAPLETDDIRLEDLSVEIGTTSRSRPCLKLRGYTYYQNRKFNDTVYWLCCEARDIKCKGKVTTDNYRLVKQYIT